MLGTGEENPLDELEPELIIGDECDALANLKKSKRAKRFARYMRAKPHTMCAFMTGTAMRKHLQEISYMLRWALKLGNPTPNVNAELDKWDEAIGDRPVYLARPPGALLQWAPAELIQQDPILAARVGFSKRLEETPGVIIIDESSCDQPINIRVLEVPPDDTLLNVFRCFRIKEKTPDDWPINDPLTRLKHGTELSCDFYYKWDPRPPRWWLDARKGFYDLVKSEIKRTARSAKPLDSPGDVARVNAKNPAYLLWKEAKKKFEPNTVAVPISDQLVKWASEWLQLNDPALVYVQHDWLGRELAGTTGLPYYSKEGVSNYGRSVDDHDPAQSAILSTHSNRRQRNLQAFNRMLVLGPEHSAKFWEQMLGRVHRYGQENPVYIDVIIRCTENLEALLKAQEEASRVGNTMNVRKHKLLTANWDWSNVPNYAFDPSIAPNDFRWRDVKGN